MSLSQGSGILGRLDCEAVLTREGLCSQHRAPAWPLQV